MANNPSYFANDPHKYPNSGIYGYILPSGYAHFADSLQEQINRSGISYITQFPSGWDENVIEKEKYVNLDYVFLTNGLLIGAVTFPIYTSGINASGSCADYTASPPPTDSNPRGHSTMSNIFG